MLTNRAQYNQWLIYLPLKLFVVASVLMLLALSVFSFSARAQSVTDDELAKNVNDSIKAKKETKPLSPPQIKIKNFRLIAVDFAAAHTQLTLSVLNTSDKELVVTAVDYKLNVKSSVIEGSLVQREKFLPKVSRTVVVPISLPFSSASSTILEILSSQDTSISYSIEGNVAVEGEPARFHFEHRGRFSGGRVEN